MYLLGEHSSAATTGQVGGQGGGRREVGAGRGAHSLRVRASPRRLLPGAGPGPGLGPLARHTRSRSRLSTPFPP